MQLNNGFNNSDDKKNWVIFGKKEALIKIIVTRDEIEFWKIGFLDYFYKTYKIDENIFINDTLPLIIKECLSFTKYKNSDNTSYTYLKILCGMVKAIQHLIDKKWTKKENSITQLSEHRQILIDFLRCNPIYNFLTPTEQTGWEFGIINKENSMRFKAFWPPNEVETEVPEYVWSAALDKFFQNKQIDVTKPILLSFFENFDILAEILVLILNDVYNPSILHIDSSFKIRSFANFIKALIRYVEKSKSKKLVIFQKNIHKLCKPFLKSIDAGVWEDNIFFLRRIIFNEYLDEDNKYTILKNIIENICKKRKANADSFPSAKKMIEFICHYYHENSDIDKAVHFWNLFSLTPPKDKLLKFILPVYKQPILWGIGVIGGIFLLSIIQGIISLQSYVCPWLDIIIGGFFILNLIVVLTLIIWIIARFIKERGIVYIDLLFPRVFAAIVIGIIAIIFGGISVSFFIKLSLVDWIFFNLFINGLTFLSIFKSIYKVRRLNMKSGLNDLRNSFSDSIRDYLISLIGAYGILTFISIIFSKAILNDADAQNMISTGVGFKWTLIGIYDFIFFPRLVLLWSGLSLFIGTFTQFFEHKNRMSS